ncbi:protein kinase [Streptomyces sp. NPDC090080]|uniref:protein kinase domain-containing protein n=1 Tax=Streptomyces sp. NPDC090080 TaxID=3365939 RepID=UPI003813B34E
MERSIDGYRLEAELGHGGQASVYRATGPDGSAVALKAWHTLGAAPAEARHRIAREAALVGRIDHPGVVRLLGGDPDGVPPYLVFEYIDGTSLDRIVAGRGPLTGDLARETILGLLRALSEIHAAPVAHLDVKPHNVVLRNDSGGLTPVLIDFGIARSAEVTHTRLTGYSVAFASPEQLRLDTAYTPSDVFSWASTVYFLLTGRHPFGSDPAAAAAAIRDRDALPAPGPFHAAAGTAASRLWEILIGCWHRDPALRWPLHIAPVPGEVTRPTCDTRALLGAAEDAFSSAPARTLRLGRINPRKAGPTPWHELGAQMRHHRRHGAWSMTRRQLASQRELLGRTSAFRLWAYEMGWSEPPFDIVSMVDRITEAQGYLRYLHLCARGSDMLGLDGRPRGSRYPMPGDRSEQHEDTPSLIELAPWQTGEFPLHIRNRGTVTWRDRRLQAMAPATGTETVRLRGERFDVPETPPGAFATVLIPVRAPGWPAVYRQRFKMVDAEGLFCFPGVNTLGIEVMIQVVRREGHDGLAG